MLLFRARWSRGGVRGLHTGPDRVLPATSLTTTRLDGSVRLRVEPGPGPAAWPPVSCHTALERAVEWWPDRAAWVQHSTGRTWTFQQYWEEVNTAARALIQLGLQPHRSVAILGANSPEWFSCGVGAVLAGGLMTGVYTTNTAESVRYQLEHSRAAVAVVDSQHQLEKVLAVRAELPDLQAVVCYGPDGAGGAPGVLDWDQFSQLGGQTGQPLLRARLDQQAINQPAAVCYTSGTTARPKGVLMSQDNLTWLGLACNQFFNGQLGEEVALSYLPIAHVVALLMDVWMAPQVGATIHFAHPDALRGALVTDLTRVRPTRFVAVPRVYEKMAAELEIKAQSVFSAVN